MTRGLKSKKSKRFGQTYGKTNRQQYELHIHHNTTINLIVNNSNYTNNTYNTANSSSSLDAFDQLKAGPIFNQVLISSGSEFGLRQETVPSFDSDAIESSHSSLNIFKDSFGHPSLDYSSGHLPTTYLHSMRNTELRILKKGKPPYYKATKKQIKYNEHNKKKTRKIQRTPSAASSTPNIPHKIPSPNTTLDDVISPIFALVKNTVDEDVFEPEPAPEMQTLDNNTVDEDVFEPDKNHKIDAPEMQTAGMSGLLCAFDKLDLSTSTHTCENKENLKPMIGMDSSLNKITPKSRKSCVSTIEESSKEFIAPMRMSTRSSKEFITPMRISSRSKRNENAKKNHLTTSHSDENVDEELIKCDKSDVIVQHSNLKNNARLSLQSGKQWRRSMLKFKSRTDVRKNTIGPDVIAQLIKDANNIDTDLNRSYRFSFMDNSQLRHSTKDSLKFSINSADILKHVSVRRRNEVLGCESFHYFNANLMGQIEEGSSYEENYQSDSSNKKEEENNVSLYKTPSVKPKISYNIMVNENLDKVNTVVDLPELSSSPQNEVFKYTEDHVDKLECTTNNKSTDCIQEFGIHQCDLDSSETSVWKSESLSKSLNNEQSITSGNITGEPHFSKGGSNSDYDVDDFTSDESPGIVQTRFTSISYSPLMFDDGDIDYNHENKISEESNDDFALGNPALTQAFEGDIDCNHEDNDYEEYEDNDGNNTSTESNDDGHLVLANSALHQTFKGDINDSNEDYDNKVYEDSYYEYKISEESYDDDACLALGVMDCTHDDYDYEEYEDNDKHNICEESNDDGHLVLVNSAFPQTFKDETQLLEAINQMDEREWSELAVLSRCGLTAPLRFSKAFPKKSLKQCCKLGEGVYSEVFMLKRPEGQTVVKIIPVEGSQIVNNAVQKKFYEILSELIITDELSSLRYNNDYCTSAFCELKNKFCLVGKYPKTLLKLWRKFAKEKKSFNDCPDIFPSNQLYVAMELAHSGTAVEDFRFTSAAESYSVFLQTLLALAVAEACLKFEHRDLHVGNILVQTTQDKFIHFTLDKHEYSVPSFGVQATIIDFTLSRLSLKGKEPLYFDLAQDPEMFDGDANEDFQFEVYRQMRDEVEGKWERHEPKTNVRWMAYLIDKFIKSKYKMTENDKTHKIYMLKLIQLQNIVPDCYSTYEMAQSLLNSDQDSLEFIKKSLE